LDRNDHVIGRRAEIRFTIEGVVGRLEIGVPGSMDSEGLFEVDIDAIES